MEKVSLQRVGEQMNLSPCRLHFHLTHKDTMSSTSLFIHPLVRSSPLLEFDAVLEPLDVDAGFVGSDFENRFSAFLRGQLAQGSDDLHRDLC